ncbi:MAG TPA: cellulose binding domain-containing protein [Polyangiaceae bacterium]|nr:cellulose binding domain-containing protein [Polyangiaceae bacterium]
MPDDCASHSCVNQQCAPATCSDNQPNQDETDVDCGGQHCGGCAAGQLCAANSGCQSLVCSQQKCAPPSCDDFTQNGAETGVDCGGGCSRGCTVGMACASGSDCASAVCLDSVCQAPRCDDNVKNGSESDRDCGTGCKPCAVDRSCLSNDDCASKACAETCSPTLHVDLLCPDPNPTATTPQQSFRIVNAGKVPFPLASLSLRYYYTKEPAGDEQYNCYSVNGSDCSLLGSVIFADVSPKTGTADRYLELHYAAKAGSLGVNQSAEIRGAFFIANYPRFTQSNDYSFSSNNGFLTSPHVTLYADGVLIWGTEPTPSGT